MSSRLRFKELRTFGTALTGPIPIISAGTPATEKPINSALGVRLYFSTASSLATRTAAAASDICELFPAVTEPSCANTVLSFARISRLVSFLGPSSLETRLVFFIYSLDLTE